MPVYEFTLVIEGADLFDDAVTSALFEAGCDDATFGAVDGAYFGDFSRTADSLADAVGSAARAIERAVPGARVVRAEPEDLATAAEIAARTGRTRESIRLLISGARGPGGFPPPVSHLRARGRLWRWADVATWFASHLDEHHPAAQGANFLAALNAALEVRRLSYRLDDPTERREVARVVQEDAELYRSS